MTERVVVITGATGKLGPYVARRFASDGARLALLARTAGDLAALAAELPGGSGRHAGIPADLSTGEGARVAADEVRERLGPAGGPAAPRRRVCRRGHRRGRRRGRVAQRSSSGTSGRRSTRSGPSCRISGRRPMAGSSPSRRRSPEHPSPQIGAYVASKAALEALTLTVARELAGTQATANVILVRTIGDAKPTHTRAEEDRGALAWLASPEAGAVNGQRIPIVGRG